VADVLRISFRTFLPAHTHRHAKKSIKETGLPFLSLYILFLFLLFCRFRFAPSDRDCYFQEEISLDHWFAIKNDYSINRLLAAFICRSYGPGNQTDLKDYSVGGRYSMINCLFEAAMQVRIFLIKSI